MTSKYFFTLALIGSGGALGALSAAGCGGGGGTATGGSATTSKTLTHTTSSSTTSSSSGTGGTGSGNHDPANATPIMINGAATMGTLNDYKTPDFYSFTGKAGERIFIQVTPTNISPTSFTDPTLIDPAIALIDSTQMNQLTYQSGSTPYSGQDAVLWVQLPADGTYYIQVDDCNGLFTNAYPSNGCPNDPKGVTDFSYTLALADTSKLNSPEVLAAMTQDGTTAKADAVVYKASKTAGTYIEATLGGDFKNATDTQVFKWIPPSDAKGAATGRPRADFYFQPITGAMPTQGGDLSDASAKAWITDMTGTTILAAANQTNYGPMTLPLDLSIPYTPGSTYYVFVQNTQAAGSPAKDFYFITHTLNELIDFAELEVAGMHTNDTSATAETLTAQGSAKTLFAVDGNISAPGSASMPDVDWFTFTVPAKVTMYGYQCDSARSGSGLGGFTLALFQSDGTTAIGTPAVETATADLYANPSALPAAVTPGTKMFAKLTAATQDASAMPNTGTQYRCYVFFQ